VHFLPALLAVRQYSFCAHVSAPHLQLSASCAVPSVLAQYGKARQREPMAFDLSQWLAADVQISPVVSLA
jgi:hypothetical protein